MIEYFIYGILRGDQLPTRYATFEEALDALMMRKDRDWYAVDCIDKMWSKSSDRREVEQAGLFGEDS